MLIYLVNTTKQNYIKSYIHGFLTIKIQIIINNNNYYKYRQKRLTKFLKYRLSNG